MHMHVLMLSNRDEEIDAMEINQQQEVEQCQAVDWGLEDYFLDNFPLPIV